MIFDRFAGFLVLLASLSLVSTAEAQTTVGNFYRQSDQNAVMYQYTRDSYCQVQNEAQMAAYGGFSNVAVVPRLAMAGRQTGSCGWPNGFFRRSNENAVYRLYGTGVTPRLGADICQVANEAQMAAFGGFAQVKVVPPSSDLGRGRQRGPVCNPRAG